MSRKNLGIPHSLASKKAGSTSQKPSKLVVTSLKERRNPSSSRAPTKSPGVVEQVEVVLAKVRPYIQMHGGDVELVGVKDGIVTLNIQGACAHCRMADLTYNNLIAGLLKEEVPGIKGIVIEK